MRIALIYIDPDLTPVGGDWLERSAALQDPRSTEIQDSSISGALSEIDDIAACLEARGHEVLLQPAIDAPSLASFVALRRPDLIFNTCDSFAGRSALEMNLAAMFELLGVSCIGASALSLGLAQNKAFTKAVLNAQGIPTPRHMLAEPGRDPSRACTLPFPLIVKPVSEDASVGIDDGSVVHDPAALAARVSFIWREFAQPALVEEFIEGREFHVSLLAASPDEFTVLPIVEIDFGALSTKRPRILGYDAKWDGNAEFSQARAMRCPATLDPAAAERIGRYATAAARCIGLRDYARVDLRLRRSDGKLFVLEVNPNPDLSKECTFARAFCASGRNYCEAINAVVECAIKRSASRCGEL